MRLARQVTITLVLLIGLSGAFIFSKPLQAQAMSPSPLNQVAATCAQSSPFFAFKPWYSYLQCGPTGGPSFSGLNDIWLIVFALVSDGVLLCGYLAVGFIIWGGILYIKSQGNPGEVENALKTIINAIIGLIITIISVLIVQFVVNIFNS